ncbi:polyprenol monophosphomannose synthase [Arenivirga flava]|uniref:Dolichol-phosphate mannosyltransferase n=1 Tax=Arenivirga flava TaxID=1930060 RepID=A0AA37UR40_9MICO|nr:polyprenol monophosphomannose synthase [Arenivirga flava]GMA27277.1 dolichol-phosphate mannosyltransferase [Arenivirga flava]
MPQTLVVIPTYDERENLESIVERVLSLGVGAHVLVVDDDSPDGTGALADALAARRAEVHVLHRSGKRGLGAAYLAGFDWALERGYEAIVEMDADGSHHPEELPRMLELLQGHDLVLGSRWVPGGAVEHWPKRRELLSRGGNLYTRIALGIDVRDSTGGYRVFRASALRGIDLDGVASQGYCFQVDLLWRALQRGLHVIETPIVFTERQHGASKMSGSIVRESLLRVTGWAVRRRLFVTKEALRGRPVPSLRDLSTR